MAYVHLFFRVRVFALLGSGVYNSDPDSVCSAIRNEPNRTRLRALSDLFIVKWLLSEAKTNLSSLAKRAKQKDEHAPKDRS